MRAATLLLAAALLGAACRPREQATEEATEALDSLPVVVLETTKGRIVMELDRGRAPKSVANFVALVRVGFYNGLIFHRVRPGFMIQAGYYTADMRRASTTAPPIANESSNGLKNLRGTVAMARTDYPHSATTQFFINLLDNPGLDPERAQDGYGYAVFGKVIEGMEVVDAIARVPTRRRGGDEAVPLEPIVITRASLQEAAGDRGPRRP